MKSVYFLFMVIEALVILFQLRALMQSSSVDYYHKITQAVVKLTEPVIKYLPFKNKSVKGFYYAGFVVSFVIAIICCTTLVFFVLPGVSVKDGLWVGVYFGTICTIKSIGYLLLGLLLGQALTSWLPSTREYSYYFSLITAPIVAPVQKIIPPIGMIDLSLMVVMLVLFALDNVFAMIFGVYWRLF